MTQLVQPDTTVTYAAGSCLGFTQRVWGAPGLYDSATEAWEATSYKHPTTEPIPNDLSIVVWFSHYGTYGEPPEYKNWGHVVSYIAGRGYLSSPGRGYGQQWFDSINEIERYFNCKYVGWSEDVNGVRVAETLPFTGKGKASMATIFYKLENDVATYALAGDGQGAAAWLETQDVTLATQLVAAHHISQAAVRLTPDSFAAWKKSYLNA